MTHYDEFGVAPTASLEEIQRAHRGLARLLHPDQIQDADLRRLAEGQLKRLNAIYNLLVDPEKRRMYDLQLLRLPVPAPLPGRLPAPPGARSQWFGRTTAVAILSLAAGFQLADWWGAGAGSSDSPEGRRRSGSGAGARSGAAAMPGIGTAQAAGPVMMKPGAVTADSRQLADENRELRRLLNQSISERDHALNRLTAAAARLSAPSAGLTGSASPLPAPTAPSLQPAAAHEAARARQTDSANGVAIKPESGSASPSQQQRRLSGTWIYSPPGGRTAPGDQYPAEYIEMVLVERDDSLWGRYRARYKVTDRALNPEVEFFFEGKPPRGAAGSQRFVWTGNGGAKGEANLRLLSENTISLDWFTSELGRGLTLGSGSAVLVRREDR